MKDKSSNIDNTSLQDQGDNKKQNIIVFLGVSLLVVILVFVGAYFINKDDDESQSGSTSEVIETQSQGDGAQSGDYDIGGNSDTGANPTAAPTTSQEDEWQDPVIPPRGEITDPSPTIVRPDLYEVHDGQLEADLNSFDPKEASMDLSAVSIAQNIFSITIDYDNSFEDSVKKILETHGTENAKKVGFRPWWIGDDHTSGWDAMIGTGSRIVSSPELTQQEQWSNDVWRMRFVVDQYIINSNASTKLAPYTIDIYMKYVDGGWYMDAFTFPTNDFPAVH